MRVWLSVLVLAVACGGSKPAPAPAPIANHVAAPPPDAAPPAPRGIDAAIVKMDHLKGEMCACKDAACAQGVSDELTKWAQQAGQDPELTSAKPTEDQSRRMSEIVKDMTECMAKAMGSGSMAQPAPPPPSP